MYFAASFGAAIMLLLLRFGPRNKDLTDDDYHHNNHDEQHEDNTSYGVHTSSIGHSLNQVNSTSTRQLSKRLSERDEPGETDSLVSENTARRLSRTTSIRKNRSALSTML